MLEMNDAKLTEFIENKTDENEALVIKQDEDGGSNDNPQENTTKDNRDTQQDDANSEVSGDDDAVAWHQLNAKNNGPDDEWYEPVAVNEKTLHEFLTEQIGEQDLDSTQQVIADNIIGNIDDGGYLRRSAAQIADDVTFNDGIPVDTEQVEKVLSIVQTMDPPGIAARDPRECLLLQLRNKKQTQDIALAITIVDKYFDEMSKKRFDTISRRTGVDQERLEKVFDTEIKRGLNPHPGYAYETRTGINQQITPDFEVELDEETGRLTVTLRNKIPSLQISETYELQNERYKSKQALSIKEQKDKKRIVDAYQNASMFIKVLKQRQETLFNTMSAIVKCQREYFLSGDECDLKPLGQQQIAEMIKKDVTAVSRATNNKYVQTPWGIRSLKSFFSEAVNDAPRHKVYAALKQLVEEEDKTHPLSDEALCNRLNEMGYDLKRRTVAKFRVTLNIPSSTERKRMAR